MAKSLAVVLFVVGAGLFVFNYSMNDSAELPSPDVSNNQPSTQQTLDQAEPEEVIAYDFEKPSSLQVLVNRTNKLPENYLPDLQVPNVELNTSKSNDELSVDQRIVENVERLFKAARSSGHDPMLASAYRSYQLQSFYYNNYVQAYGQTEADKFSAKPGTSEHQTGLAIDIARSDSYCYLEQCFEDTELGAWLADNVHRYGFIVRYPKNKSEITGYQYEPWHFRYVGEEIADEIYQQNLTYEEYVQNSAGE